MIASVQWRGIDTIIRGFRSGRVACGQADDGGPSSRREFLTARIARGSVSALLDWSVREGSPRCASIS
jgi:hypothetical protein